MKRKGVRALLISKRWDGYYLSGFTGEDSAILLLPNAVHVLSDGRFDEAIRQECPWASVRLRRGSLNAEIANACKDLRIRSLAVQPDHRTMADQRELDKLGRSLRCKPAPGILADMRRCKDANELAVMRRAIAVAEGAFQAVRRTIRAGQTELEVAARLEYEMKIRGASGPAFPTICAVDANAALPHAHAGNRTIKRGSAVLIDWGARVGHYCSDLTRVLFIGSIPSALEGVYRVVLEAQRRAIAAIRPGARMCDVDAVARMFIKAKGFEKEFNHGLGHGLGLDVHEPPSLSWRSKEKLKAGMVVTVEPGIYLPGVGGVRIEDDVLVTKRGPTVLSRLGKTLKDAVVS
jgi:Xaa-Pro aminopeptidase